MFISVCASCVPRASEYCITVFFPTRRVADPHPVRTNIPFRASKMATLRDAEYNNLFNRMSLDTCVLLDGLWVMTGLIPRPIIAAQVPRQRKVQDEGTSTPFFV